MDPIDLPAASSDRKRRSHERIVEAAARALRRDGYGAVGVADVMRAAGLTHGGFYAHFASREALLVEAIGAAGQAGAATVGQRARATAAGGASRFRLLVDAYLSEAVLDASEVGCPVAALASEMPRQSPALREASAAVVRGLVRLVERALDESVPREQAGPIAATLVGSVQLARALGASAPGRALLAASRADLLERFDRPGTLR